jgi:hypothetical protein
MCKGIALAMLVVVGLSACAPPGAQPAPYPPAVFEHRVSAADVSVFWNCTQPEPNVLQVAGVVQNIGGRQVQFAEVEVVAVNAKDQTVSSAKAAVRDILLQSNQRAPFLVQLRILGDEARFDMYYWYYVSEGLGVAGGGQRRVQNMARDVCSPAQHRAQSPG